ncbi:MAG TPA: hypothetical protein DCZ03_08105, partial [Gammaproteobacteria bacterium]|nr:hypothetical protein [Gammaproteobacteria bacterium]
TLRKGPKEGILNLLLGGALASLFIFQLSGNLFAAIVSVLFGLFPAWLFAVILRETVSLSITIEIAAYLGLIVVVIFHYFSNLENNIVEQFKSALQQATHTMENAPALPELADLPILGLFLSGLLMTQLISLFFARYWQAALFNPGGFKREFHQLRMSPRFAWIVVGLVVISILPMANLGIFNQLLVVGLAVFFLVGLSLLHYLVGVRQLNTSWLVGAYVLMVVLPHLILLVAVFGLADSWFNFRRLWQAPQA